MTPRFHGFGDGSTPGAAGSARDGHLPAELVAAYVDEEMESRSASQVERHLAECAACRDSLRLQRAVRDRLRQEPPPGVPLVLRDRVFDAVRGTPRPELAGIRERAQERRRPRARLVALAMHPGWAVAASVVVTAIAYSWFRLGGTREPMAGDWADAVGIESSDSAGVVDLILGHAAAWNMRDAKAAAALLTADALWVTSTGIELQGRAAIELAHRQWFAQDSATGGTTHIHPPGSISVRFLRPDVAVADLEGQFLLPATAEEPPAVLEQARIFVVATKDADGWRIAQLRNLRRQGVRPTPR